VGAVPRGRDPGDPEGRLLGWWILVAFVPLLNTVVFLVFAFSTWPAERELAAWRARWWSWRSCASGSG
jgi:hypothetical protein